MNLKGEWLGSALHAASRLGRLEVVKVLLEKEPNRDAISDALKTAAYWGRLEVAKALLDSKTGVDEEVIGNALYEASVGSEIDLSFG